MLALCFAQLVVYLLVVLHARTLASALGIRSCKSATKVTSFSAQSVKEASAGRAGSKLVQWKDASGKGRHAVATAVVSEPLVAGTDATSVVRLSKSSGLIVANMDLKPPYTVLAKQRYIEGGLGRALGGAGSTNWWCGLWAGKWGYFNGGTNVDSGAVKAEDGEWGLAECVASSSGDHTFFKVRHSWWCLSVLISW